MAHWTPPNRGVTTALTSIPTGSSFPLMGDEMRRVSTASTDGGTLVSRSGMSKSGPAPGGKANRRNVLMERGGPCGGIQVKRVYRDDSATGRNVYTLPSAFSTGGEFRSAAHRS